MSNETGDHGRELVYFNGINGTTGLPVRSECPADEFARSILSSPREVAEWTVLRSWHQEWLLDPFRLPWALVDDAANLAQAQWGVIYAAGTPSSVKRALQPLIEQRSRDTGTTLFEETYRPGETAQTFLARFGTHPTAEANPNKVPYYLLLVGDPTEIPFSFQYDLDFQYAVGRICFDHPAKYRAYAESVVRAQENFRGRRRLALFGPHNQGDEPTRRTCDLMMRPLLKDLEGKFNDWKIDAFLEAAATKERLAGLLGGPDRPDILFVASHGMAFDFGDPRQREHQGAIVCREWPGRPEMIRRHHWFAAEDVGADARLDGSILVLLACHSSGTPESEEVRTRFGEKPRRLAAAPFGSRLAQKALEQGALAVMGHVDSARTMSISWTGQEAHGEFFVSLMAELMSGRPIGLAAERLSPAFAAHAGPLLEMVEAHARIESIDVQSFLNHWGATKSARNFVVYGDPAVRICTP